MIVVLFLALFGILAYYKGAFVRKHAKLFYMIASVLSILAFIFKDLTVTTPIIQGFLGLGLFYLVMVTGALKKKSPLRLKLMGVRREYSILGFIFITPHTLNYTLQGLNGTRSLEWFGLIAFVLMIPLFITSFVVIRKKMTQKTWKNVQSIAYIIYLLLFIHLILNYTRTINLVLYLIMFIGYFGLKIVYEMKRIPETKELKHKKTIHKINKALE